MSLKQEIMLTRLQECAGRGFTLERERRAALSRRLPAFRDDVLVQRGQAGTSPPPRSLCPTQCPLSQTIHKMLSMKSFRDAIVPCPRPLIDRSSGLAY